VDAVSAVGPAPAPLRDGSTKKERADPLPKLCPECKAVLAYKALECSECGAQIVATSMVREASGELVELGSRRSGARETTLDEKEAFYSELKWVQSAKGHRSGWCWHQYQARFNGEPPKWFELLTAREPSLATRNWLRSRAIAYAKRRAA
jgi:DNA repair protein RadD